MTHYLEGTIKAVYNTGWVNPNAKSLVLLQRPLEGIEAFSFQSGAAL